MQRMPTDSTLSWQVDCKVQVSESLLQTAKIPLSYSDGVSYLTGLSVFSLSQWSAAMDSNFMVGRRGTFSCTGGSPCDVRFETVSTSLVNPYIVGSNAYDRVTDTYTCPSTGTYLFTWTLGAPAGTSVRTMNFLMRSCSLGNNLNRTTNVMSERFTAKTARTSFLCAKVQSGLETLETIYFSFSSNFRFQSVSERHPTAAGSKLGPLTAEAATRMESTRCQRLSSSPVRYAFASFVNFCDFKNKEHNLVQKTVEQVLSITMQSC